MYGKQHKKYWHIEREKKTVYEKYKVNIDASD